MVETDSNISAAMRHVPIKETRPVCSENRTTMIPTKNAARTMIAKLMGHSFSSNESLRECFSFRTTRRSSAMGREDLPRGHLASLRDDQLAGRGSDKGFRAGGYLVTSRQDFPDCKRNRVVVQLIETFRATTVHTTHLLGDFFAHPT